MRVATMIIGIFLAIMLLVQSCTVFVGGELFTEESMSQGGAVGIFVGFLFIIGGAFALKIPKVSIVVFAIGAVVGFIAGATTEFGDMTFWAIAAVILSILSFAGHRRLQRGRY